MSLFDEQLEYESKQTNKKLFLGSFDYRKLWSWWISAVTIEIKAPACNFSMILRKVLCNESQ